MTYHVNLKDKGICVDIKTSDTGIVFTWCQIDTKICSTTHFYSMVFYFSHHFELAVKLTLAHAQYELLTDRDNLRQYGPANTAQPHL